MTSAIYEAKYCYRCNELWDLHPRIGCSARLDALSLATTELERLLDAWEYALTTGRWQKCANCGEPHSRHDHDACPFKTEIAAAREAIERHVAEIERERDDTAATLDDALSAIKGMDATIDRLRAAAKEAKP